MTTNTTKKLFEPSAETLREWASLVPGVFGPGGAAADDRIKRVRALMAKFATQGFTPVLDGKLVGQVTQSLGQEPDELAMAHWSHSKDGELDNCGLAWTVAEGISEDGIEDVVQALLSRLCATLGEPSGDIWQLNRWRQEGCPDNSPALAAFWPRPLPGPTDIMQAETMSHEALASYRKHLREVNDPLTMLATLTKEPGGLWSLVVLLRI